MNGPATRRAVTELGAGARTLVFVHGLGVDQRVWSALAPRFATDHRVVLFDLVGETSGRNATLEDFARDLLEVVASVRSDEPPIVVGHSLGAALCVLAASLQPSFASHLVLMLLSPRFLDDLPDYRGGFSDDDLNEILGAMDHNFVDWAMSFGAFVAPQADVGAWMGTSIAASDPRSTRRLTELAFRADLRPILPRVTLPTLSIQSRADPVIPYEAGHLVAASIPHARETVLDVPGHCPHLSHPALVERAIREYLSA